MKNSIVISLFLISLIFLTPLIGQNNCSNPHLINNLPFQANGLLTSTGPSYHASDFCGLNTDQNEKDYIFSYTPQLDEYITIGVYSGGMAGIYVFTDCTTPLVECVEFAEGVEETFLSLVMEEGETYYIFVGTPTSEQFNIELFKEEVSGVVINGTEATQTLDVHGGIRIRESNTTPFKGTLQWSETENELMGYDGSKWVATKTRKLDDLKDVLYQDSLHSIYLGNFAGNDQLTQPTTPHGFHTVAIGDSALAKNGQGASDLLDGSFNAVLGSNAGFKNTTGFGNNFIGFKSAFHNETGHSNVAIGNHALFNNRNQSNNVAIGDSTLFTNGFATTGETQGASNTAIGAKSGFKNSIGSFNNYFGHLAGYENSRGSNNNFFGVSAGQKNTTGGFNLFMGNTSGFNNSLGNENIFLGHSAGTSNTFGNRNIFIGVQAAELNTNGSNNIAIGKQALYSNTSQNGNVAIGDSALFKNGLSSTEPEESIYNTSVGYKSGEQNNTGDHNAFFGAFAGNENDNGRNNSFFGFRAGAKSAFGNENAYFGTYAGREGILGESNTFIGYASGISSIAGRSNVGLGAFSALFSNGNFNVFLGASARTTTNTPSVENSIALGYNVFVNANNQVRIGNSSISFIGGFAPWTDLSDGRFKTNVKESTPGLDFIKGLRPVSYQIDYQKIQEVEFKDQKNIPAHFTKKSGKIKSSTIRFHRARSKAISRTFKCRLPWSKDTSK